MGKNERVVERDRGRLELAQELLKEIEQPSYANRENAAEVLAYIRGALLEEVMFRQEDIAARCNRGR